MQNVKLQRQLRVQLVHDGYKLSGSVQKDGMQWKVA